MTTLADVAARCVCCDLPLYSCGRTVEARQRAERAELRVVLLEQPGVTRAQYPGRCAICHEPVAPGDPIRPGRDEGGWVGQLCCGEDPR